MSGKELVQMSEYKNNDSKQDIIDLKSADAQKRDSGVGARSSLGDAKNFKTPSGSNAVKRRKKKTPIVADVIAGILIIAIAIGVVVGTVYMFQYQSNDYGTIEVEYQMLVYPDNDDSYYMPMKNKSLYVDADDNSIYFGKVTDIEFSTDTKGNTILILTVTAQVKYRESDGYLMNDHRLSVGKEYTVRSESIVVNGVIVELDTITSEGGK